MKNRSSSGLVISFWISLLSAVMVIPTYAVDTLFVANSLHVRDSDSLLSNAVMGELDTVLQSQILSSAPTELSLIVPIALGSNRSIELQLFPVWNGDLNVLDETGRPILIAPLLTYRGAVSGDPASLCYFSVNAEGIFLLISDSTGNYVAAECDTCSSAGSTYSIYADTALQYVQAFQCGVTSPDTVGELRNRQGKVGEDVQFDPCRAVTIQVECEYELFALLGSNEASTARYIVDLFGASADWSRFFGPV